MLRRGADSRIDSSDVYRTMLADWILGDQPQFVPRLTRQLTRFDIELDSW